MRVLRNSAYVNRTVFTLNSQSEQNQFSYQKSSNSINDSIANDNQLANGSMSAKKGSSLSRSSVVDGVGAVTDALVGAATGVEVGGTRACPAISGEGPVGGEMVIDGVSENGALGVGPVLR